MTTVRYFAGAAEAAGCSTEEVTVETVEELMAHLSQRGNLSTVLGRCAVLVDGVRGDDPTMRVAATSTVDILPPFAGG